MSLKCRFGTIRIVKYSDNSIAIKCNNIKIISGHLHFLSYVSIDPVYQNRGIATKLIQYWVETVLKVDLGVCGCSGFTESGFNYLIPIFDKLKIDIEFERKISF